MRIIAGELKGRKLETPADNRVRPTTDKVKEAIFSMISGYIPDATVIDMFAGTGSLGLEAISRGAAKAYFVDRDKTSLAMVRRNIQHVGAGDRSVVIWSDFNSAAAKINDTADVIFLDPPYKAGYMQDCIALIDDNDLLVDDGIIVAEHGIDEVLPDNIGSFVKIKTKKYSKVGVSLYEKQEED